MTTPKGEHDPQFREAVRGLLRGDFSRLDPLFDSDLCRIVEWVEKEYFDDEPQALAEALACACFNGRTAIADFLLTRGVDPSAGAGTGLKAFHWAANRGQLETVRLLIERKAPLETESMHGGTVLGTAVWSALNEPCPDHLAIIEALLAAGANVAEAGYPSGDERIDELLRRHGAAS